MCLCVYTRHCLSFLVCANLRIHLDISIPHMGIWYKWPWKRTVYQQKQLSKQLDPCASGPPRKAPHFGQIETDIVWLHREIQTQKREVQSRMSSSWKYPRSIHQTDRFWNYPQTVPQSDHLRNCQLMGAQMAKDFCRATAEPELHGCGLCGYKSWACPHIGQVNGRHKLFIFGLVRRCDNASGKYSHV